MRIIFGACIAVSAGLAVLEGRDDPGAIPVLFAVSFAMGIVLLLFHQLTVSVSSENIRLRFGIGLIKKQFTVSGIRSAKVVRNRWWYGLGIRFTGHGWLYCVSGLDAVEIHFKNGRKNRIGTDEPERLHAAIAAVLSSR